MKYFKMFGIIFLATVILGCKTESVEDQRLMELEAKLIELEFERIQGIKDVLVEQFQKGFEIKSKEADLDLNNLMSVQGSICFLKLSNNECESCVVTSISILKKYKRTNPDKQVFLLVSKSDREFRLFESQYDLDGVELVNITHQGLKILEKSEISYYGVYQEGVLKEVFPTVDLILTDELIESFFDKAS
jgi:hypothetical protein